MAANQSDERVRALAARLKRFEFDKESLTAEELSVARSSRVYLDGLNPQQSQLKPRLLRTNSLRQYKNWIGVDDSLFEKNPHLIGPPLPGAAARPNEDGRKITNPKIRFTTVAEPLKARTEHRESDQEKLLANYRRNAEIQRAAHAYLFGNSRLVEQYRTLIEEHYAVLVASWWGFLKVVVEVDGTLDLGAGTNVLTADEIVLHPGASIRSRGMLKIDCNRLVQL
jgi:hypothetical protein